MKYLILFILFGYSHSFAASAVELAVRDSGALKSDSLETKVALLLHLFNDEKYLLESSPDPQLKDFARFSSTPYPQALKLMAKYKKNSSGGPYSPYDLDSARTPQEMLEQRIGGACGTNAQVVAELLMQLGTPPGDIRVVNTVCIQDYEKICPGGKGSRVNAAYRSGASGHAFVQVKVGGKWKLINTTYAPFLNRTGKNAAELQKVYQSKFQTRTKEDFDAYQVRLMKVIRKLDSSDFEMVDFPAPEEIEKQMGQGKAPKIPEFESLPETLPAGDEPLYFRKMVIYEISSPEKVVLHKFADRLNLIASGRKDSDVCRFNVGPRPPLSKTKFLNGVN